MTPHHLWLDVRDWIDRNADLLLMAAIAALFTIGAVFAGNTDHERCQLVAITSPSVATAPASPIPSGLQAGAPSHCEATP